MTITPGESGFVRLQRIIDKGQVQRMIAAMLDGTGLSIRALKNELVITNPSDPEMGQIYVEYATGYVSWERTVWQYWGALQGYEGEDSQARADDVAAQIRKALGQPAPQAGNAT
jgi:hypothetical protein